MEKAKDMKNVELVGEGNCKAENTQSHMCHRLSNSENMSCCSSQGTKSACGEGGCGSCSVEVYRIDSSSGKPDPVLLLEGLVCLPLYVQTPLKSIFRVSRVLYTWISREKKLKLGQLMKTHQKGPHHGNK